ncbi:hypothetical protein GCM10008090_08510 [Arenicella chitinivorans]|uniref:Nucleotidyltransferase family protein n=1 Tax=Arenicella chitinivorans TaxID=1329800 RepID=A0A918RM36_9GAMM|nr:nucleotidyltransferase family protein [Arenicella chitinivorans]GHA01648.1 hypothetical protein GCM10008090_08510 [Arenicella chitinivorans]
MDNSRTKQDTQVELQYLASLICDYSAIKSNHSAEFAADWRRRSPQAKLERLDYHGITLLADAKSTLSVDLATACQQRRAMLAATETLKQQELRNLFSACRAAGLGNIILFKGTALAHTVYPQPWYRPRSDADCLINPDARALAHQILTEQGFAKHFAIEGRYVSYQSLYSKSLPGQSQIHIDLHWRINNRQCLSQAYTVEDLWPERQTIDAHLAAPSNVDSLLIACLHRLGHHAREERLAWLYDIHLLSATLDQYDWETLINKARQKSLCAVTLDALQACAGLLGTQLPNTVLDSLSGAAEEPSAVFTRRDLPEWRYFLTDLRCMPSLRQRMGLLRETFLPSPSYVRTQMQTSSATLGYLKRLWRGLKRVTS